MEQSEQAHRGDRRARAAAATTRVELDAGDPRRAAYANIARAVRAAVRRLRPRAEVPAGDDASTSCAARYVRNRRPTRRATMITTTLDAMAAGGIHDQLGGGFARYSTDDYWLVPHFEKMLYDNALLTRAYLHGYLVTGEARYRARRRRHRRVRAARPAPTRPAASTPPRTPTPRASRASSTVVARRDPRGVRRRRRRGDRATTA